MRDIKIADAHQLHRRQYNCSLRVRSRPARLAHRLWRAAHRPATARCRGVSVGNQHGIYVTKAWRHAVLFRQGGDYSSRLTLLSRTCATVDFPSRLRFPYRRTKREALTGPLDLALGLNAGEETHMIETFTICAILIAVFALGYLVGNAKASRSESRIDKEKADRIMLRYLSKGW